MKEVLVMLDEEFYLRLENEFTDHCVKQKLCSSCKYSKEMTNCAMVYAFEKGMEYEKKKMRNTRSIIRRN